MIYPLVGLSLITLGHGLEKMPKLFSRVSIDVRCAVPLLGLCLTRGLIHLSCFNMENLLQ